MTESQTVDFDLLNKQLVALLDGEADALASSANFVALVFASMSAINWCGIYVRRGEELVLGPFQGKPACVRMPVGQGVCGTAAAERRTIKVADVHSFEGHIACDPASRSEIVVPLVLGDQMLGVLDIDSPDTDRFTAADQAGVELLCHSYIRHLSKQGSEFI